MKTVYFDNAATTPLHPLVLEEMIASASVFGNPSSLHAAGRKAKAIRELVRRQIAEIFHVTRAEVLFTSGATEANNIAIASALRQPRINRVITSKLEHASVLAPCQYFATLYDKELVYLPHDLEGKLDLAFLEAELAKGPAFIALMHGNNELGNINPIAEIGRLSKQSDSIFHCDVVQTVLWTEIDAINEGIDSLSCSAHKFYGPKGVGVLVANKRQKLQGLYHGGGQEKGFKPGTENIMGIAGLGKAFELLVQDRTERTTRIASLREYTIEQLTQCIDGLKFNGSITSSLPSILNFQLPCSKELSMVLLELDLNGVQVSGGSACSSGSSKGSHVIEAIGKERIGPSIRVSFNQENTKEEVNFLVQQLQAIQS